jgi:hypothetical protein
MRDAYCAIDCLVAFMHSWAFKHFHKGLLHTRACDCDLTLSYRSQVVDDFSIFYLTFFLKVRYTEFLHYLSYLSCGYSTFISKPLVEYCLRYNFLRLPKAFTGYCVRVPQVIPDQVKRHAHRRSMSIAFSYKNSSSQSLPPSGQNRPVQGNTFTISYINPNQNGRE